MAPKCCDSHYETSLCKNFGAGKKFEHPIHRGLLSDGITSEVGITL